MPRCTADIVTGGIGGLLATVPMTFYLLYRHRRLPQAQRYKLPPRLITDAAPRRLQARGNYAEPTLRARALAAHFAFGAVCGSLYGPAAKQFERTTVTAASI